MKKSPAQKRLDKAFDRFYVVVGSIDIAAYGGCALISLFQHLSK